MEKENLWNEFLKSGSIEKYMNFKAYENGIYEKKGEITDEVNKGERDSNTRNSI